jgi:hypothetical protein
LPDSGFPATGAIVGVGVGAGFGLATAVRDAEGLGVTFTAGAMRVGDDTTAGASAGADDVAAGEAATEAGADDAGAEEATGEGDGGALGVDDTAAAALDSGAGDSTAAFLVELVHAPNVTSTATAMTRRAAPARPAAGP